jgi:hypothetical protein
LSLFLNHSIKLLISSPRHSHGIDDLGVILALPNENGGGSDGYYSGR